MVESTNIIAKFRLRRNNVFPVTGEFPAQRASNVENVSIWWLHHGIFQCMHTVVAKLCRNSSYFKFMIIEHRSP